MTDLWQWILSLGALFVSVIVAVINGRSAIAAQKAKSAQDADIATANREVEAIANKAAADNTAGELALAIAREAQAEIRSLRKWQRAVMRWWPWHDEWDDAIVEELEKLDPGVMERMPPRPEPPLWDSSDNTPTP